MAVWPRRSWSRSLKYLAKRVLRLTASPHAIAAGIAAGVFASFTPFMGFHFIISFCVAYVIAGNFIAAASGTFFGNPITFPFIWASTYSTGNFLLTGTLESTGHGIHRSMHDLAQTDFMSMGFSGVWTLLQDIWNPLLKPMAVGAIPLGVAVAAAFYIVTRLAAVSFQATRRKRLSDRAREIKRRAMASASGASAASSVSPGE